MLHHLGHVIVDFFPVHVLELVVFLEEGALLHVFEDQLRDFLKGEAFARGMSIDLLHILLVNHHEDFAIRKVFQGVRLADKPPFVDVELLVFGLIQIIIRRLLNSI